jgi:hypothetical protein
MDDTIYPIEDTMLVLQYGGPKEARLTPSRGHMGEPEAGPIGFEWIKRLFDSPQYQLEEALKLYQEALKLQSQQALALKEMKANHARRDPRPKKRVSGSVTKSFVIAAIENGPPSAEPSHNSDKENGSPINREHGFSSKIPVSEPLPPQSSFKSFAMPDNDVLTNGNVPTGQGIKGIPATHEAVVFDRASEESSSFSRPETPLTPSASHDVVIRTDSDVDVDEHASEMTGNEDKRLSGILNDVDGLNLTSNNDHKMTTQLRGLGVAGARENGSSKRDSFHDMYEYAPAGIETEVVQPATAGTGAAVKVRGMLAPESARPEQRFSMMFDRSARPASVYRTENSKWEQRHARLERAETLTI